MSAVTDSLVMLRRELPDGCAIEFEEAPVGSPTQAGTPRQRPHRAYFYVTPDSRVRVPSVTTLLDSICPKAGLPPWAESKGIQGAMIALRAGEIDAFTPPLEAVERVRGLRLGADAARDEAAERGLDMHAFLEEWMRTGTAPNVANFPPEQHGYVQAGARWLMAARPEPQEVEQLVCDPTAGYAGRSDLVARIEGARTRVDFKSSAKAAIYSSAHIQTGLYERAAIACGDAPTDRQIVVVLGENGSFRSMLSLATPAVVDAALAYYRAVRPIDAACESANRAEKKARA